MFIPPRTQLVNSSAWVRGRIIVICLVQLTSLFKADSDLSAFWAS